MGRYDRLTNVTSLLLSSHVVPFVIWRIRLSYTARTFPTLLLIATIVASVAAPGNLAVLFISLSVLKAMTCSVHDEAHHQNFVDRWI